MGMFPSDGGSNIKTLRIEYTATEATKNRAVDLSQYGLRSVSKIYGIISGCYVNNGSFDTDLFPHACMRIGASSQTQLWINHNDAVTGRKYSILIFYVD